MPISEHAPLHPGWNNEWRDWIADQRAMNGGTLSSADGPDAWAFAMTLSEKFGVLQYWPPSACKTTD